jgi:hypothetical protein
MTLRVNSSINACSCKAWEGFNGLRWSRIWTDWPRLPQEKRGSLSQLEYCAAYELGRLFPSSLARGGWQGGGWEVLVGLECNAENPNQQDGHVYSEMASPILQRMVARWHFGVIHLSPWSSGEGDTGSQIRTVTWCLRPYRELEEQLDLVESDAEGGCTLARAFMSGFDAAQRERRAW